jgi:hypothetical protein
MFIIEENVVSDQAEDRFSLEVLTPMADVVLDIGILENSFSFPSIRLSCRTKKIE